MSGPGGRDRFVWQIAIATPPIPRSTSSAFFFFVFFFFFVLFFVSFFFSFVCFFFFFLFFLFFAFAFFFFCPGDGVSLGRPDIGLTLRRPGITTGGRALGCRPQKSDLLGPRWFNWAWGGGRFTFYQGHWGRLWFLRRDQSV